jgi:hypothetical protein
MNPRTTVGRGPARTRRGPSGAKQQTHGHRSSGRRGYGGIVSQSPEPEMS